MRTRHSRMRAGMASCLGLLLATPLISPAVHAQRALDSIISEVVVTARKLTEAEAVQDTPIAITAFGSEQLDALQFRDLSSLSYTMPNVALEDVGTSKGIANFTVRGLGINSSIPSIDPTVGVFVDGMYLGITTGVVLDMFDLEAVEMLRGPQGILFGRNVTGGAVLVRTRRPSHDYEGDLKVAAETGRNMYYMGSVAGPLQPDSDTLSGRLSVYYNDDDGWHENRATGEDFGQSRTRIARPSLMFTPNDKLEVILRYEYGKSTGDGPAAQNRALFDRDTFRFALDEDGFFENRWQHAILEANRRVAFGDGLITNILAWRDFGSRGVSDIDSTPSFGFHAGFIVEQDQLSNELRYAGRFLDRVNVTSGVYYFEQEIGYQENRGVATGFPPPFSHAFFYGGGIQDQRTWGVFTQADYDLTPEWTLTVGARYTYERKEAKIASLNLNQGPATASSSLHRPPAGACDIRDEENCDFNFRDRESWTNFTPKLGLQWTPVDNVQFYGFWTQGVRSGGYNLRNTDEQFEPGPFGEEKQDSFELGLKYDTPDRRGRLNTSVFYNRIRDMQREVNRPSVFGTTQIVRNTADARIYGIEVEGHYQVLPNFLIHASAGYLEGDYTKVRFDLSGDGEAGSRADRKLDIPRLTPFTGSVGATYEHDVSEFGYLTYRLSLSHRDRAAYTDDNRGKLNRANMLDASIAFRPNDGRWSISLYGKNLLDEVTEGGDTQLPAAFGGQGATFSPLNKGRIIGAEARLDFGA